MGCYAHKIGVMSVLSEGSIPLSDRFVDIPASSILLPSSAIMVPLSMQRRQSGQYADPPLSDAIV